MKLTRILLGCLIFNSFLLGICVSYMVTHASVLPSDILTTYIGVAVTWHIYSFLTKGGAP